MCYMQNFTVYMRVIYHTCSAYLQSRVALCMQRVEDILDLKFCTDGVQTALQDEDYEKVLLSTSLTICIVQRVSLKLETVVYIVLLRTHCSAELCDYMAHEYCHE